ncbi:MAG: hypothetical protein EGQ71_06675 [Dialister sp.]|nr:hypothetical protein [Dialister sp.]
MLSFGSGFKVQGSGFKVQGSGFRVQGSGFRVQGSGFRVQGSRFKVQGSRFRGEVAASPPFYFDIHSTPLVWFCAPQHFHGSFCLYRTR